MKRSICVKMVACLLPFVFGSSHALAADVFPSKPVTIMVPYPAGGLSDVVARMVNMPLAKQLNQTVLVENLGGASGGIAAQKILNAPSDGYYIFQGSPNELILGPLANAAIKFKSEDFRLVQMIGISRIALLARPGIPANTTDELIDYARKIAKEGKTLTYASVGIGSFYHLLGEQFSSATGIPMTHVPYRGGAPAIQDLIGNQVDIFFTPFGMQYAEFANQGKLKMIAVLDKERISEVKNIPTTNESRQLKNFNFDIWTGYFVKKDTPEPIVQALHKVLMATMTDPALRSGLEAQTMMVAKPQTLSEAAKVYSDGTTQFRAIAKAINLQPQ